MARSLSELDDAKESSYAIEFEEASLLTLGTCYEKRPRFAGSAYNPILKRVDGFLDEPLSEALEVRASRAARLLEIDDLVADIVKELKEKGFDSPYLKQFVVARINPIRFKKKTEDTLDDVLDAMLDKANGFDVAEVKPEQVTRSSG
jgi:ParB family chromosome partitioning protein